MDTGAVRRSGTLSKRAGELGLSLDAANTVVYLATIMTTVVGASTEASPSIILSVDLSPQSHYIIGDEAEFGLHCLIVSILLLLERDSGILELGAAEFRSPRTRGTWRDCNAHGVQPHVST